MKICRYRGIFENGHISRPRKRPLYAIPLIVPTYLSGLPKSWPCSAKQDVIVCLNRGTPNIDPNIL